MELKEINSNKETLMRNLLDLIELQHILKKTQVFFQEVSHISLTPPPHPLTPSPPHLSLSVQAEAQSMRPGRDRRLRARDTESDRRGEVWVRCG